MAFCCERPEVSLADSGEVDTFVADVFRPRPSFDQIVRFQAWGKDAGQKMREAMTRKNCAVSWVQLVIDQHGLLVILRFKHPVILATAKTAAKAILTCLPKEQHRSVHQGLRPLDEVDRDRILAWATVQSLRPKRQRQEEEEEEGDEEKVKVFIRQASTEEDDGKAEDDGKPRPFFRRKRGEETADAEENDYEDYLHEVQDEQAKQPRKTAAEMLAVLPDETADASDEDEADVAELPRLMLTDAAAPSPSTLALPGSFDPASVWEFRAKQEATIVFAEAGARPDSLKFIRCHREDRRQLLLQGRVKQEHIEKKTTLLCVVRVAMKLAEDGKIPGIGKHGRRSEFLGRCSTALAVLNPKAETVVTRLPSEVQALIRSALGGNGPPYEGCLSQQCLDKSPEWVEARDGFSRCARCKLPKCFGRSVKQLGDILQPSMTREKAKDVARSWYEMPNYYPGRRVARS